MNKQEMDAIDGNHLARQTLIGVTHIMILFFGFTAFALIQSGIIAVVSTTAAKSYLLSGAFIPLTFLIWVFFVAWYAGKAFVNPEANLIQATDNPLWRRKFDDGSTCFIVYETGFALKYPWERLEGKQIKIEAENDLLFDTINVTIGHIALEIKPRGAWRVYVPRLSAFLQNIDNESKVILDQLRAAVYQEIEVFCSGKNPDGSLRYENTQEVRRDQNTITQYLVREIRPRYLKYGIDLIELSFEKCDYSQKTQEELNKVIELEAIKAVAQSITPKNLESFRMAAAAAGKAGVKVSKNVQEIVMSPEVAKAIEAMGPAGAMMIGLTNNQQNS